ncbi:hypothetical protein PMZ80_002761 [Knufia obscura]|uniref:Uncharacterized protein n=2 Tax=Knufia TaxID=430999 RepID=A0AAN8EBK9_9EURO|nr:hypothetical protein PMZ80_002761 [Knufia obscura]KAK5951534.1 hypothetical protein OHC33_007590 [Knufia fluminis]
MSRASKSKSKRIELPRDVTPYWLERGYRPEIAALGPAPNEDPAGEEAYQRAFLELAQTVPPRLPNPSHYPNSPSAREYVRKRSMDFQGLRGEKRQGEPDSQQVTRKFRDPDQSPIVPGKKSTSTSPASNYSASSMMPPPSFMATPRTREEPPSQYGFQPQIAQLPPPQPFQTGPRLGVLEPFGAPSGPVNKLK